MSERNKKESWMAVALRPDILRRSIKVGLVVGSILALINHGEMILSLSVPTESLVKICVTYLVPFSVSTWASVQTARNGVQAI